MASEVQYGVFALCPEAQSWQGRTVERQQVGSRNLYVIAGQRPHATLRVMRTL
jgi:hypothetical protein